MFIFISVVLLAIVLYEFVSEFLQHKLKNPVSDKRLQEILTNTSLLFEKVDAFFAKVPDDLELTHRFVPICIEFI